MVLLGILTSFFSISLATINIELKRCVRHVRSAKIQIFLHIHTVRSEFSLGALWLAKDANFLQAYNKGSEQSVRSCAG